MCHITIVKKTSDEVLPEIETAIKDLIVDKMSRNKDGFFVGNPATNQEVRTLDQKEAEAVLNAIDINGLIVHSRFATAGAVDVKNVHGWTIDGWTFAHNGQVFDYADSHAYQYSTTHNTYIKDLKTSTADTDSLILFKKILASIKHDSTKHISKVIRHNVADVGFWGRACLYDSKHDRLFLFGDWHLYLVMEKYLLMSSSDLDFDDPEPIKVHGLKFEPTISGIHELLFDGLAVFEDFSKDTFEFRSLGKLETGYKTKFKPVKVETTPKALPSHHKVHNFQTMKDIKAKHSYNSFTDDDWTDETFFMLNKHGLQTECLISYYNQIHSVDYQCCDVGECNQFYPLEHTADEPMGDPIPHFGF